MSVCLFPDSRTITTGPNFSYYIELIDIICYFVSLILTPPNFFDKEYYFLVYLSGLKTFFLLHHYDCV
jgi:hypothetical protein